MTSTITMATATLPPASNNLFLLIERLFFFPMSFFATSDFVLSKESAATEVSFSFALSDF